MTTPILLSTDIGSDPDDALAVLSMMNAGLDLRAIYTVNARADHRAYIAKHLVDLAKEKITVASADLGKEDTSKPYPLFTELFIPHKYFDDEATGYNKDPIFTPLAQAGIVPNGAEHFIDTLASGNHIIFSIAPLSLIAYALKKKPDLSKNIERLYVMGCRFAPDSNIDHNVFHDPLAAATVLSLDIPTTIIPGDICSKYRLDASAIDALKTRAGIYCKKMARGELAQRTSVEFTDHRHAGESLADIISRLLHVPERYTVNLDDRQHAAYSPDSFFNQYRALITHIREHRPAYTIGNIIADELEQKIARSISVADVYVPYCFANPEKTTTKKHTVTIDLNGNSFLEPGSRHDVIRDLDFDHFKTFLETTLK